MAPKKAERLQTLDVKDVQILLHGPDDPDAYTWHHRVMLLQICGGRLAVLDPELELSVVDLDDAHYLLLNRKGKFCSGQVC